MKTSFSPYILIVGFVYSIGTVGCKLREPEPTIRGKVYIENIKGKYRLIRNGQPYTINGVCGQTDLKRLVACGGNTIRTYDTIQLGKILDEAQSNNLAVMAGIFMPMSDDRKYSYDDSAWTAQNVAAIRQTVLQNKDNPALLIWCVGNELNFRFGDTYDKFYEGFNKVVDMIHEVDPNHPVTTTIIDLNKSNIINVRRKTRVDIISFNVFNSPLQTFGRRKDNFSLFWDGPYLISEWGVDGPWGEGPKTSWQAPIELTSTEKAKQLGLCFDKYIPLHDNRLLGTFSFFWGFKQETTHTWFSFFSENGAASSMVAEMQRIWTGKYPLHLPPRIDGMQIDRHQAKDELVFAPDSAFTVRVIIPDTNGLALKYDWKIYPEDWFKSGIDRNSEKLLSEVNGLNVSQEGDRAVFRTPAKEGPYRVFLLVYDQYGNFSSCNRPFYILSKN
ncbi:MAG: glycoside hydrolase family 2 TIM barrel-domain containing protein [Chitinophagaceae bacterium]